MRLRTHIRIFSVLAITALVISLFNSLRIGQITKALAALETGAGCLDLKLTILEKQLSISPRGEAKMDTSFLIECAVARDEERFVAALKTAESPSVADAIVHVRMQTFNIRRFRHIEDWMRQTYLAATRVVIDGGKRRVICK